MELDRSRALGLIHASLDALNQERAADEQIEIADDTPLLASESSLDSLAFISFVADLEDRLLASTERDFVLVGELESTESHPFRTVSTLADHIIGMAAGMG